MNPKAVILLLLAWLSLGYGVTAANIYVSQVGSGSQNGADASDAFAWTWITNSAHWNSGAGTVSAGDTVHLVGTISSNLIIQASGTQANPITILFEANAIMTAPTLGSGLAWILGNTHSNITIDGGFNGVITCTDNGTTSTYGGTHTFNNHPIDGVAFQSTSNIIIKNLVISNMYDRQVNLEPNLGGGEGNGIVFQHNCNNILVSNCVVTGGENGITQQFEDGGICSGFTVVNCVVSNYNHGIVCGTGGGTNPRMANVNISHNLVLSAEAFETPDWVFTNSSGAYIGLNTTNLNDFGAWSSSTIYTPSSTPGISNVITSSAQLKYIALQASLNVTPGTDTNKWATLPAGDYGFHRDGIFLYNDQAPGYFSNVVIAYNLVKHGFHPNSHTAGTSPIFIDFTCNNNSNMIHGRIFNNITTSSAPTAFSGGGGDYTGIGTDIVLANNTGVGWTLDGTNWSGGTGFVLSGTNAFAYNNIIVGDTSENLTTSVTNISYVSDPWFHALFNQTNGVVSDYNLFNFVNHTGGNTVFSWTIFTWNCGGVLQNNVNNTTFTQWTNYWAGGNVLLDQHSSTNLWIFDPSTFAPLSNDTASIGKGTNLSQYFTDDYYGNPRPSVGAWSVGAVQIASTNTPPSTNLIVTVTGNIKVTGSVVIN